MLWIACIALLGTSIGLGVAYLKAFKRAHGHERMITGEAKALAAVKDIFDKDSPGNKTVSALRELEDDELSKQIEQKCLDTGIDPAEGLPKDEWKIYRRRLLNIDKNGYGSCRGCGSRKYITCLEKKFCSACKWPKIKTRSASCRHCESPLGSSIEDDLGVCFSCYSIGVERAAYVFGYGHYERHRTHSKRPR